jgi:hypothetical protein
LATVCGNRRLWPAGRSLPPQDRDGRLNVLRCANLQGGVGVVDVAQDEIAERIHQARNHGHGYQQRWQRAVLATAARNDHLADLREEDVHRAALL